MQRSEAARHKLPTTYAGRTQGTPSSTTAPKTSLAPPLFPGGEERAGGEIGGGQHDTAPKEKHAEPSFSPRAGGAKSPSRPPKGRAAHPPRGKPRAAKPRRGQGRGGPQQTSTPHRACDRAAPEGSGQECPPHRGGMNCPPRAPAEGNDHNRQPGEGQQERHRAAANARARRPEGGRPQTSAGRARLPERPAGREVAIKIYSVRPTLQKLKSNGRMPRPSGARINAAHTIAIWAPGFPPGKPGAQMTGLASVPPGDSRGGLRQARRVHLRGTQ